VAVHHGRVFLKQQSQRFTTTLLRLMITACLPSSGVWVRSSVDITAVERRNHATKEEIPKTVWADAIDIFAASNRLSLHRV